MKQETLDETVKRLNTQAKTARILVLVHLGITLAALVLLIVLRQIWIPLAVLVAGVLFYVFAVRTGNQKYSEALAEANLRNGLCGELEEVTFQAADGVDRELLRRWAVLPVTEKLRSRSTVSGRKDAVRYFGSEVTTQDLAGTLLIAETDRSPRPGDWLLLREELLGDDELARFLAEYGYRPSAALLEGWDIFTRTSEERIPDDTAIRILSLTDEAKFLSALRLAPEGAAAFLKNRFYTGTLRGALTEHALRMNTLPERDAIWAFFRWWLNAEEKPEENS